MWTDDDYHQVVFKYKVGMFISISLSSQLTGAFIVCKVLHLSSNATNVPVDYVEDKMKLYDQLGDMCAHKNVQFYNAAIKFYKMEVNFLSYISTALPFFYTSIIHCLCVYFQIYASIY